MDLSLRQLEQAVSIRRQIDVLERRLAGVVGGGSVVKLDSGDDSASECEVAE